jgi:uroporphyrinogen-III synthase
MAETCERPLAGLTILVTRPAGQAAELCGRIEAAGGRALHLPLLEIVPVDDPGKAAEHLGREDYWDWVIFVSANAVRFAAEIGGWTDRASSRTRIAAVGAATAGALEEAGIRIDLVPKPQFNSESLLADPAMADAAGRRILIVRGVGGREHLAEALKERGAEVVYAEVYRRAPPSLDDARPVIDAWRQGGVDAVVLTSGEALGRLMELLGTGAAEWASTTPLAVIGERIAGLARNAGWSRIAVAERAGDRELVDALVRLSKEDRTERPAAAENSEPIENT